MKPGSVVLLMSTISPGYCQTLAIEAAEKEVTVLDCPLNGLVKGAIDGTLSLMIGVQRLTSRDAQMYWHPLAT